MASKFNEITITNRKGNTPSKPTPSPTPSPTPPSPTPPSPTPPTPGPSGTPCVAGSTYSSSGKTPCLSCSYCGPGKTKTACTPTSNSVCIGGGGGGGGGGFPIWLIVLLVLVVLGFVGFLIFKK